MFAIPARIAEKSIAVLPFDNLSEEKQNAYFAVDVQDEGNKTGHWRGLPGVTWRAAPNEEA